MKIFELELFINMNSLLFIITHKILLYLLRNVICKLVKRLNKRYSSIILFINGRKFEQLSHCDLKYTYVTKNGN